MFPKPSDPGNQGDKHGFSIKEASGLTVADLIEEGGSIEDLTIFQSLAMEHSFVFDKRTAEERDMRLSSLNNCFLPNNSTENDKERKSRKQFSV